MPYETSSIDITWDHVRNAEFWPLDLLNQKVPFNKTILYFQETPRWYSWYRSIEHMLSSKAPESSIIFLALTNFTPYRKPGLGCVLLYPSVLFRPTHYLNKPRTYDRKLDKKQHLGNDRWWLFPKRYRGSLSCGPKCIRYKGRSLQSSSEKWLIAS